MKILAVDDDPLLIEMLQLMLPTAGYSDVTCALGSHQALDILQKPDTDFDCFLLDIQMPDIDGVELCRRIHQMQRFQKTPKVMLTAMSEIEYINRAFAAGATDYITKPFEFQDIKTRLGLVEQSLIRAKNTAPEPAPKQPRNTLGELPNLPEIRYHLQPGVMANYLASLGRLNLLLRDFYLVSIEDFEPLANSLSELSTYDLIEEICHEFSDCIQGGDAFFSYVGGGEFVFAFNGRSASVDDEFAYRLKIAHETACEAVLDPDNGPFPAITLSNVVKPSIFNDPRRGVLDALLVRLRKGKKQRLGQSHHHA